ncbi:LPS assembly lipoprotein LptE [Pontibacter sp. JAM-7]|uniref:LPS-assembly lipoprotein LptE n=1 Tax=Pontibacter sp. JAM-7 TaxID=3366581 RepID=UPI003AF986CF
MKIRMFSRPLCLLLIAGMVSLISACGFHLRGAQDVPADKQSVTLQVMSASSELLESLRDNLRYNDIEQRTGAPYRIVLLSSRYKRRAVSLSNGSEVDEYELSLLVTFHIADSEGNPLTEDIRLQQERVYTYNRNAAAASSEQERLFKQELHESVAQSILRRYLASGNQ